MAIRIGVWRLELMAPDRAKGEMAAQFDARNQAAVDTLQNGLNDAEAEISALLPDGFYVKVS